ncbi:MAG: hypothetical protein QN152_12430 [Armatimonadota bacterium]|nr:hypothetical protein [Armatimonadota bacterium]MDR7469072.1 hypothetical protein [Armatimonadota bacterium]MDR7540316.1 hypothetical protein [Armatimonadota bacterium]
MMETAISILKVVHIATAILMAWPFYALVAVNQRARLGAPLGDRADTYMENVIKNRTIPCYVFQGTALMTGLALVLLRGLGLDTLVTNPILGLKFLLLLLIAGLLTYVHTGLQPRIDTLFVQAGGNPVPRKISQQIGTLRLHRKRIASTCMFVVLTVAMLGVQVWTPFPLWLTVLLVVAIGAFTWRAYSSVTPYGWV